MLGFWHNRSVFVTGCTGLLGSWLIEELIKRGANVTGLVRDAIPRSRIFQENLEKKINIVSGDVENFAILERLLVEYEVDTVFHLAAQSIVEIGNRDPVRTFETNIRGTWNILEACRRVGNISRIIVASSLKAYGEQSILPYGEDTCLQGKYPYDVSKTCGDLISTTYNKTYQLPVCITRCSNFYGGGDLNFSRLVPATIRSILRDKPVILRSDGRSIRDYFYIRDGALAYINLAEQMDRPEILGEAFNFSNETQLTVIEMVRKILNLMNKTHIEPIILDQTNNELKHQYLSVEKAKSLLNWKPCYTLEEGLAETINWYKDFFSLEIK